MASAYAKRMTTSRWLEIPFELSNVRTETLGDLLEAQPVALEAVAVLTRGRLVTRSAVLPHARVIRGARVDAEVCVEALDHGERFAQRLRMRHIDDARFEPTAFQHRALHTRGEIR